MTKKREPETPARIKRLIAAMSSGQRILMTIKQSEVGDEKSYCYERSGKPVGLWTVQRALRMGLIVPSGDGLFEEFDSQTYRLVQ